MINDKIHQIKIKSLIHKLGLKYNLSDKDIREIVNSPYEFTQKTIKELDLDGVRTEEDLNNVKTNFYFKNLFRLYIPFSRVNRRNIQKKTLHNLNKEWKK